MSLTHAHGDSSVHAQVVTRSENLLHWKFEASHSPWAKLRFACSNCPEIQYDNRNCQTWMLQ